MVQLFFRRYIQINNSTMGSFIIHDWGRNISCVLISLTPPLIINGCSIMKVCSYFPLKISV